ncbi:monocarboxylate transporter 12-like [Clavelina lepadiformis]|uniref:monocarboxylate transporter 12-like n=1 Tax=Clavelina lepadiformis TaxID=159417 RepID=UPI00404239C2
MTSLNISFLILASGTFVWTLWSAAFRCYPTFYQTLMVEFELKYGDVSWLTGFVQGGYGLGNLLFPVIYKYVTFRIGVMASAIVSSAAIFISSFAVTIWQIYVCCGLVIGFCLAGTIIGVFTMLPRHFKHNRDVILQIACSGLSMGSFIYCPLFQILIDGFQWRGALWIISGIFLQPAVSGALLGPSPPAAEDEPLKERKCAQVEQSETPVREVKNGATWRLRLRHLCERWDLVIFLKLELYLMVFAWFTFALSFYSAFPFMIPYGNKIGLTDIQASSLASAVGFGELGSRVFYSVVMNRCPQSYRYIFLTATIAFAGLFFFLLAILKSYAGLMSVSAIIGVLGGGADAVYSAIMIDLFGVTKYPSVYGYTNVMSYIMGMLGTVTLGYVIDLCGSETIAIVIGGCSLLLSSGFVLLINRKIRRKHAEN